MSYDGHQNYNYWNVHLWLTRDEDNSNLVRNAIKSLVDKDKATRYLLTSLPERTPDGVKYTFRNVREALKKSF